MTQVRDRAADMSVELRDMQDALTEAAEAVDGREWGAVKKSMDKLKELGQVVKVKARLLEGAELRDRQGGTWALPGTTAEPEHDREAAEAHEADPDIGDKPSVREMVLGILDDEPMGLTSDQVRDALADLGTELTADQAHQTLEWLRRQRKVILTGSVYTAAAEEAWEDEPAGDGVHPDHLDDPDADDPFREDEDADESEPEARQGQLAATD